ncbi:MAG TPA: phenylalanine--tRNA ligase subunit beta [Longimicrobiales bacterium]|nr:phenylalanine--tRNA ligase subunit beta [Longimicrobiales bacterium]
MNISYRWLLDLVPGLDAGPQECADRLAMLGAPVDEVVDLGGPLRDIVIGRVERAGRHPNADRLTLCVVDAGGGDTVQVVCGAPNVTEGAYYPFAPVGARLPGDVVIRRARIRGEESQGMLCSPRELGLGRDHEGIMQLQGTFTPGASFVAALGLDDARLAVDVTPNRPDLLSHLGVARELAAAYGLNAAINALSGAPALPPIGDARAEADPAAGGVSVRIDDVDLCPRYFGLVIRGVKVGPSPEWLASRLRAVGLRPISNVVDATNHVLHELGQPLHAFDLDRLGPSVVVRRARHGERMITLDGVDRALSPQMLVIADDRRPVAIAGVMGGADTEVQESTTAILLECALFDPQSVRATRTALGLSTDASYRFERGVDPDGMRLAIQRAAELIAAVAGGSVEPAAAVAGPGLSPVPRVQLRLARVAQVLGEPFTADQVAGLLAPLGFGVVEAAPASISVTVPGHRRHDVGREEDLIEEIARRHGYDRFSDELRPFRPTAVPTHPLFRLEDRLRTVLVGRGCLEARTAAFAPEDAGDVALLLPLAATESRLRRDLLPGLVRRVEYNFARGARSIRLFELGTAFARPEGGDVPAESTRLALVLTGPRQPAHWSGTEETFDLWDVKGIASEIAAELGLALAPGPAAPILDDALSFRLLAGENGEVRGSAGRIRPDLVDAPAWAGDVWGLEVELTASGEAHPVRFRPLPAHPSVERDLALLLPASLPAAHVAAAVRDAGGEFLEHVAPFDVYVGAGVADGQRSVAYRLRFRAADRTLTDAEVDEAVRRILRRLNDDLGVQQRA